MRITGGTLGGRHLRVPAAAVRPTQDRVREALFSSLQEVLPGASFLDLFAGSGSVGLEAWSRGASAVCWVEEDRRVYTVLKANVSGLCGDEVDVAVACRLQDVFAFCRTWRGTDGFDIIFADPPYDKYGTGGVGDRLLEAVGTSALLKPNGLLVMEQGAGEPVPEVAADARWSLLRERRYGGSCLRIFRKEAGV